MKHIRFSAAIAVASGVAVASLALPSAAAAKAPSTTKNPAAAAAGYLASQLAGKHHDHYTGSYQSGKKTITYVNFGETADAITSMDAAGVAQNAAGRATKYLESHVKSYAGRSTATYAPGPIGKLLIAAEAQHVNVQDFGGLDLVGALVGSEGGRGAKPGEYQQNPSGTPANSDYFSTVSQALAMLGLSDTPDSGAQPDQNAVTFLVNQQCGDGGYPTQILDDPTSACSAGEDIDSTAYAVQALLASGAHGAAALGLAFLVNAQHHNGGFGTPTNANSTAIATEALIAGHRNAAKAETWLAHHQVGCGSPSGRRGAVKFQKTFDASALLATSQAAQALAGRPIGWVDRNGAHAAAPVLSCPAHHHKKK